MSKIRDKRVGIRFGDNDKRVREMRDAIDRVNHNKRMREFFDRFNNEHGTNYKYEDDMSMNDMREMFGLERV